MEKCVFAGSFDPITNGHLEVIKKASQTYEQVTVGILVNWDKNYYLTKEQRIESVTDALSFLPNVVVKYYDGTLTDFLKQENTNIFVRGIRNIKDLEYENMCKEYHKQFMPDIRYVYFYLEEYKSISSSLIKHMAKNGEDISLLVPKNVIKYF